MGRLQAEEMQNWADFDTALRWHIRSNHFPPVPSEWIPVAKQCIEKARDIPTWDDGEYVDDDEANDVLNEMIENPVRGGQVQVRKVMKALHLWSFV